MLIARLFVSQVEQLLQRLGNRRIGILREDGAPAGLIQHSGIDAFLDAGPCAGEPSTVVDLESAPGSVVRVGRGDPAALGLD